MKITAATIEMADGSEAVFVDGSVETRLPPGAFVAIPVADLQAAVAVVDTQDRSKARKRASEKDEPETSKPGPGPLPSGCVAPACPVEALPGKDLCHEHVSVDEGTANEWRRAQEKAQGRKRAQKIRESVEPGTDKVA